MTIDIYALGTVIGLYLAGIISGIYIMNWMNENC